MKKIKAFFTGLKARLRKWWTSTLIPVKRVVLLCSLLSLVAFGVGSCSAKKPYQTASAAESSDAESELIAYDYIDFICTYAFQIYAGAGFCICTPLSLRIQESGLYYIASNNMVLPVTSGGVIDWVYYKDNSPLYYVANSDHFHLNVSVQILGGGSISDFCQSALRGEFGTQWDCGLSNSITTSGSSILYLFKFSKKSLMVNFSYNFSGYPNNTQIDVTQFQPLYYLYFHPVKGYQDGVSDGESIGYTRGYNDGFSKGNLEGSQSGYDNGYNVGTSQGYQDGYNKGLSEKFEDITPWQILVNGVNQFFNAKLFGTVSLSVLLSLGLGIALFVIFMRSLR